MDKKVEEKKPRKARTRTVELPTNPDASKKLKDIVGRTETLPLPDAQRPQKEFEKPQNLNVNTMENGAFANQTGTETPVVAPADAVQPTLEDRVNLLEINVGRLDERMSFSELLHRNVKPDGNVAHFFNIIPTIAISAATGAIVVLSIQKIIEYINKKGE